MRDVTVWRVTAADCELAQRRSAGGLAARGLVAGQRVVLAVPSSPELLAVVLGALRTGVVPVLLNPALLAGERAALVADAEPSMVVEDAAALAALVDGPPIELAPVPLARPMHYTSGTSGRPKGVWSGVLGEAEAATMFADEADLWAIDGSDVHLVCSPLYHSAPLRFAAGTLLRGGDIVLLSRFEAGAAMRAIEVHAPTTTFMVPGHLQRLFADGRNEMAFRSFRLLTHAGAPCPESLKRRAMEAFPSGAVWEFYGSTEGQFTVCSPAEWQSHPGSVGRARPGRTIDVDATGQIWCGVPPWARFEYWRDPEKTEAAWRGSAFTVGDLGRLDGDGFLFIDGRRDDLIISGGANVYPAEVEHVLASVPGVEEVAVFGVLDERWGQRVCAAVVGAADEAALRAAAVGALAPYKRPKDLFRVEDLPRTGTGKVRRSQVAAALGLEGSPPGGANDAEAH